MVKKSTTDIKEQKPEAFFFYERKEINERINQFLYSYTFKHDNIVTLFEKHIIIKCFGIKFNQFYSEYKSSVFHLDFGDWTTLYKTTFPLNLNSCSLFLGTSW